MKKICFTLLLIFSITCGFSQIFKEDRATFANSIAITMSQDSIIKRNLYLCMARAFPRSTLQKLEAKFEELAKNKDVFDLFILEVMKSFDMNKNSIITYFNTIGGNKDISAELYKYMNRKYYSKITDFQRKRYQEWADEQTRLGKDTVRYYASETGNENKIHLVMLRNGEVSTRYYPSGNKQDSMIVNGKWKIDSLLHFYFQHTDGSFINTLFNKGQKDNLFKIANEKTGICVTSEYDNTEFYLMNNTCQATLQPLSKMNYLVPIAKGTDTIRYYESPANEIGRYTLTLQRNGNVSLNFYSLMAPQSASLSINGSWQADSLLYIRFKKDDAGLIDSMFNNKNEPICKISNEKGYMFITLRIIHNSISLMNDECKLALKTDRLRIYIAPSYPFGTNNWKEFLEKNLNPYVPKRNDAPVGLYTVTVSFTIDENGKVTNVRTLYDPQYDCGAEAIRVVSLSPDWTPAIINGRRVKYELKQNIVFRVLQDWANAPPITVQELQGGNRDIQTLLPL